LTWTSLATAAAEDRLARAVFGVDVWLRRWRGVFEYTADPDCIFRLELVRLQEPIVLSDGTMACAAGDVIAQLHLWNEHIPAFPAEGATLQWARHMTRCIDASLRDLAWFLNSRHDLRSVKGVRGETALVSAEHTEQLLRICARYGFRVIHHTERRSFGARLHRLGENILVALMVLARNPRALRRDCLVRSRLEVFVPRAVLDERYKAPEPGDDDRQASWRSSSSARRRPVVST
jgi:hypothetical protein